jgi:hypothetical protein
LTCAVGYATFKIVRGRVVDQKAKAAADGWSAFGAQGCRPDADKCFSDCPQQAGKAEQACGQACMSKLERCVEAGDRPLNMRVAGYGFAGLIGPGPDLAADIANGSIRSALQGGNLDLGIAETCRDALTRAYIRLSIDGKTGAVREAHALATPPEFASCVSEGVSAMTFPKHPSSYGLYVVLKP